MAASSDLIAALNLTPHPEGGWYRRTWAADSVEGERPLGSAIYYLLQAGEGSAPHRIDATEIWHFYAGATLELRLEWADGRIELNELGSDIFRGETPQVVVPPGVWQSARSRGDYTLIGATVCPAFSFEGFELRSS